MVKLIVLDLDGTLLDHNRLISEANLKSIKLAKEKGIKVCIATGRSFRNSIEYAEEISANYLIFYDGASIYDVENKCSFASKSNYFFNLFKLCLPFDNLITKASATKELCKSLEISLSKVLAIGDDMNDIKLIKCVGIGATTSNAIFKIKRYANYISPYSNCNDGVAEIISKFCLD